MKIKKGIHPIDIKEHIVPDNEITEHIIGLIQSNGFRLLEKKVTEPITFHNPYPQNYNVKTELIVNAISSDATRVEIGIYKLLLNDGNIVYTVRADQLFGDRVMDSYLRRQFKRLCVTATEMTDFDEDITKFIKRIR